MGFCGQNGLHSVQEVQHEITLPKLYQTKTAICTTLQNDQEEYDYQLAPGIKLNSTQRGRRKGKEKCMKNPREI